jgi:DNA-binding MarR family transcriptional regulator
MDDGVLRVLRFYPQVYLACHGQHRTPQSTLGLSEREARVLGHLDRTTAVSPAWLARHVGVNASTLSAAVARLRARGLLTQVRRSDDRRRADLRLTASGQRAIAATSVLDAEVVRTVLARLAPEERRRAVEGLELLARASSEHIAECGHVPAAPRRASRANKRRREP